MQTHAVGLRQLSRDTHPVSRRGKKGAPRNRTGGSFFLLLQGRIQLHHEHLIGLCSHDFHEVGAVISQEADLFRDDIDDGE